MVIPQSQTQTVPYDLVFSGALPDGMTVHSFNQVLESAFDVVYVASDDELRPTLRSVRYGSLLELVMVISASATAAGGVLYSLAKALESASATYRNMSEAKKLRVETERLGRNVSEEALPVMSEVRKALHVRDTDPSSRKDEEVAQALRLLASYNLSLRIENR